MTISKHRLADGELRTRVVIGRVDCPRVGLVDIDRCRECAYLLRLEDAVQAGRAETHVVCSAASAPIDLESAW